MQVLSKEEEIKRCQDTVTRLILAFRGLDQHDRSGRSALEAELEEAKTGQVRRVHRCVGYGAHAVPHCWILRASYSPLVNGGSNRYQQHTLSPGHSGCASASAVATPKSRLKTSTGTPSGKVAEVRASSALVP